MRVSFTFEVSASQSSGPTSASKAEWLSIYRCATLSLVLGLAIASRAILLFGYYGGAVDFVRNISVASIVWVIIACVTRFSMPTVLVITVFCSLMRYPFTWSLVIEFVTAFIFFVLWLIVGILCIARYSTSLGIIGFVQIAISAYMAKSEYTCLY
jgi:hypothetical protein